MFSTGSNNILRAKRSEVEKLKSRLIVFAAVLLLPLSVFATVSVPAPQGFVNDFANIIDAGAEQQLESTLETHEQTTKNEITVVTVSSLADMDIELFAVELFKEWGIGKKNEDNGVLLLVAPNERRMRIEVGYGLEPYITDSEAARIIRDVLTPAFRQNDFSGGITRATELLIQQSKDLQVTVPAGNDNSSRTLAWWLTLFFEFGFIFPLIILQWLLAILARTKSWWLGGVMGFGLGALALGIMGFSLIALVLPIQFAAVGLALDYFVSKNYHAAKARGRNPAWWAGGSGRHRGWGGGGRGFGGGGFGGGGSGGGGSSGGW